jgi:hypothetical protein
MMKAKDGRTRAEKQQQVFRVYVRGRFQGAVRHIRKGLQEMGQGWSWRRVAVNDDAGVNPPERCGGRQKRDGRPYMIRAKGRMQIILLIYNVSLLHSLNVYFPFMLNC